MQFACLLPLVGALSEDRQTDRVLYQAPRPPYTEETPTAAGEWTHGPVGQPTSASHTPVPSLEHSDTGNIVLSQVTPTLARPMGSPDAQAVSPYTGE